MNSRACVFINSNDPNVRNQLLMNTVSFIKPKFPPKIDLRELITKQTYTDSNRSSGRAPNAFIIYRKAFVEAARKDGYQLPMTIVSSMASRSWDSEPDFVKEEYKKLAKEANSIRNKLIPKFNRRRKRQKWNIVSFPPTTPPTISPTIPPATPPTPNTKSNNDKSKSITKEKKLGVKEIPSSSPNNISEGITFHIPYDITSPIIDRLRFLDDSDNLYFTNSAAQQQQQQNFNNFIPQSSVEPNNYYHVEEEQVVDTFNAAVNNSVYINNEFDPELLTFFNDYYGISYPSFWEEF